MQKRISESNWFVTMLAFVAGCAMFTRLAHAGGFEIPNQGARGAAQAEAFGAQADDPSAIYYNPAGIGQLKGTQISAGIYGLFPEFRFKGDNGSNEAMRLPSVLPHFYVTSDLGTEKLRVGFGVFNSDGLNLDWGDTGPLRTIVNKAQLRVIDFSPVLAYNVTDSLTVAIAGNIYWGEVLLERNQLLAAPPVPEANYRARGRDWAAGVTPSMFWKINDRNTVGVWYRSPFTLDLQGHARVIDSGVTPQINAKSTAAIDFPQIAGFAYAFRPTKPWKVEADVVWTDWDTLNSVRITSPVAGFGQSLPARWKSGFSFRAGTQYDLSEHWAIRGGYAFGQRAIPGYTFSALIPDSNYHLFTAGLGYQTKKWSLDGSYQFAYRESRHITNTANSPVGDGVYDNQINTLMFTFTYKL